MTSSGREEPCPARNLFESSRAGDDPTLGGKAIGVRAFHQPGAQCDVVAWADGSDETWTLRLRRSDARQRVFLELFEIQSQEGPCLDCYRNGQAVVNPNLAIVNGRWPRFAPVAGFL